MFEFDIMASYFDMNEQLELVLRIVIASVLGYLIGFERTSREKSAGMRTHAIVAMGAALMMVISKYGFGDCVTHDGTRIAAQIVSGLGFLGAGVIFVRNNAVSGLTTAAGLWTTAGIGMAIGAGCYFLGIVSGVWMIVLQLALHRIPFLSAEPTRSTLKLTTGDKESILKELEEELAKKKVKINNIKVWKESDATKIELDLTYPRKFNKEELVMHWSRDARVISISG